MDTERPTLSPDSAIRFAHTSVSEVFPTLIWLADLASEISEPLNRSILAKLDAITGPRIQRGPSETFQTEQDLHRHPEFAPLVRAVDKVAAGALQQLAIDTREMVFSAMWANVNPPGAKHSVHSHPNNYFSGIYYIQCDAKANVTRFFDPRPQAEVIMPPRARNNVYNGNQIQVDGKPGRIALFPAWLKHDVPTNLSGRERITVSFDLMFPRFTERMSTPLWEGGSNKGLRSKG